MSAKQIRLLFIILLLPISISFFEARFLPKSLVNYSNFLFCGIAFVVSLPFMFIRKRGFVFPIQLIVLAMVISLFMAQISWGQSISNSIKSTVPVSLWIFFFFLLKYKVEVKKLEWIIVGYGLIYIFLYYYQYRHSPNVIFGGEEEYTDQDRGILRILFPGGGIFILMAFMALNKFTSGFRPKWLWLGLAISGLVITVLQVTRQAIFAVFILYLFHLLRDLNIFKKAIVLIAFAAAVWIIKDSRNPIIQGIMEAQTRDNQEGRKNNIRYVAATYFLNDFAPNKGSQWLGNGVPYALSSGYAILLERLADMYGFYLADVGLVGFYVMFGVLAVLAYVLIWVKSVIIPLPKDYYYVRYYLWYLLITSLTSNTVFHPNFLLTTVFALYIYQTVAIEEKPSYSKEPEFKLKKEPVFA